MFYISLSRYSVKCIYLCVYLEQSKIIFPSISVCVCACVVTKDQQKLYLDESSGFRIHFHAFAQRQIIQKIVTNYTNQTMK